MQKPELFFDLGSLVMEFGNTGLPEELSEFFIWDSRTKQWRCEAYSYRSVILSCRKSGFEILDCARKYEKLNLVKKNSITPRTHQKLALEKWIENGSKGVISLPTGAGKTILAMMAISSVSRPTLVVVPTIDLLYQWNEVARNFFDVEVGLLGGGNKEIKEITISTYDSASIFIESLGNRFGFIIFDECHHLPAPNYQLIARAALAPFRMGLSATPERSDGKEEIIYRLLGELVYVAQIREMTSDILSPYDVVNIQVPMSDEEYGLYREARETYVAFLRRNRISFAKGMDWIEFVKKASYCPGGREAMKAYRDQKRLAQSSKSKLQEIWRILLEHRGERTIIFTDDNALAYNIGSEFILPVLTHKTKDCERKYLISAFRNGEIEVLVTSKVLNEGVDVPEAAVGIVVSGSGAVREHVQRLGRILRHRAEKRAILYEIVSKNTSELYVNSRRRKHNAYEGSTQI
ncbi:MAG: DEAD/DEAH box helicase family protein [Oligoflexales bacterium]|nr:DEAD/DEAH box helicase family protein [Oligoflexales bacterium]